MGSTSLSDLVPFLWTLIPFFVDHIIIRNCFWELSNPLEPCFTSKSFNWGFLVSDFLNSGIHIWLWPKFSPLLQTLRSANKFPRTLGNLCAYVPKRATWFKWEPKKQLSLNEKKKKANVSIIEPPKARSWRQKSQMLLSNQFT